MQLTFATLVPVAGVFLYAALLMLMRPHSRTVPGGVQFSLMLALLCASSIGSVVWHSLSAPEAAGLVLRLLTWTDLSVAPVLLWFVSTRYETRLSHHFIRAALAQSVVVAVVSLSGAVSRAILTPLGPVSPIDASLAYGAILSSLICYVGACAYLVAAYGGQRDPFERNRLKFVTIGAALILAGQLTNLVPALQQFPIDRSFALVASALVFYAVARYRLLDADVVVKRSLVDGGAALIAFVAYLAVAMPFFQRQQNLLTPVNFLVGFVLLVITAFARRILNGALRSTFDRLLSASGAHHDGAIREFAQAARSLTSRAEVAAMLADVCVGAMESRFATTLLVDESSGALRTAASSGAFRDLHRDVRLDLAHSLVTLLAGDPRSITADRFAALFAELDEESRVAMTPLEGCVLQPIILGDQLLGAVAIGDPVYEDPYTLSQLDLLGGLAAQAAVALQGVRYIEEAESRANTDFLTGLPNHRHLQDLLEHALAESEATQQPVSVAMIDVDNFKLLNDTHGHIAGDQALRTISTFISRAMNPGSIVGRYGGDEFLVILPQMTREVATAFMTKLERDARRLALTADQAVDQDDPIPVRLSWGVAVAPDDGRMSRLVVGAADSELLRRRHVRRRAGKLGGNVRAVREGLSRDPHRMRIVSGLLDLLDAKDPYTTEHSQQVASLVLLMADELDLPQDERDALWLGGLLHDVGKLGVPESVIRKPGSLNEEDWAEIRKHPVHGRVIIEGLLADRRITEVVMCHHERFDGSGYPFGLVGDDIPKLARVVSVADAFSAMVHDRPYRKGLTAAEAIQRLREGAGTQWDPEFVDVFARTVTHDPAERVIAQPDTPMGSGNQEFRALAG